MYLRDLPRAGRRLTSVLFLAASTCSALFAQASIEQYFPQLQEFQFEGRALVSGTSERQEIGGFSTEVLDDYVLISYSKWLVRSLDPTTTVPCEMVVYEMQDAAGAYGIFSLWEGHLQTSWERLSISVDNYYSNHTLSFWRGNYFFHLTAQQPSEHVKGKFRELAAAFVRVISLVNLHPVTVVHLPQEHLIPESVRFYLGESSFALNRLFPDQLRAQIGFSDEVEITHARYAPDGYSLFLMGYPTIALAAHRFVELQNAMHSYFSPQGVYMKRVGVMVSIFFGPEEEAREVLAKVRYAPRIKWIFDREAEFLQQKRREDTLSYLRIITRSMLMTLFFVMVTVGGGVAVGCIRYQLVRRYPAMAGKDRIVRLEL